MNNINSFVNEKSKMICKIKNHIYTFLFILAFLVIAPITQAQSCATIESITVDKTEISSGDPYHCAVTVDAAHGGTSRSIGCGISFDGGFPADFCPSDEFFGGWSGNTANFNCIFPNTNIPDTVKTVEMVGYDFANGCGPAQGKRVPIKLNKKPQDGTTGTPGISPTPEDPNNQEDKARDLLKNFFIQIFSIGAGLAPDSTPNTSPMPGNTTPEPTSSSGNPNTPPVTFENCASISSKTLAYTCQVYNEIKQVCNQKKPGQVLPENRACLQNVKSLTPNAKANMMRNALMDYCYGGICSRGLQCMGFAQGIYSALNGDLPDSRNPFMGKNIPPNLVGAGDIAAAFNVYPLGECKQKVNSGTPIWFIWGFHIAIGTFAASDHRSISFYEGNSDYYGTVNQRSASTDGSGVTHCLVPKNLQ